MLQLNLPEYDYTLKKSDDGQLLIWDLIRKQYMILTPEEWVRQHFLNYLIHFKTMPVNLIRIEAPLKYDKLVKWADILVYNRSGTPLLIVECKASTVSINEDTLAQLAVYDSTLKAPYLALTNGLTHYYLWNSGSETRWLPDLPCFEEM